MRFKLARKISGTGLIALRNWESFNGMAAVLTEEYKSKLSFFVYVSNYVCTQEVYRDLWDIHDKSEFRFVCIIIASVLK